MTGGISMEYWDTCIFLAYIKGEQHKPGELEYIRERARLFDIGQLRIVTSTITVAEVREADLKDSEVKLLRQLYRRSNFLFMDVSLQISDLAADIRNHLTVNPFMGGEPGNPVPLMLQTPDAIHVASAIAAQRGAKRPVRLLTLDCKNKVKSRSLGMTKLVDYLGGKYALDVGRPDNYIVKAPATPPATEQTSLFDLPAEAPPPSEALTDQAP